MKLVAVMLLAATAAGDKAPDGGTWMACEIRSVSICAEEGCRPARPAISVYLSSFLDQGAQRSAYYRCAPGLTQCDRYNALAHRNGDFTIFSLPSRSLFAKLGRDNRVTDVAAMADTVVISRGLCRHAAPPPSAALKSR